MQLNTFLGELAHGLESRKRVDLLDWQLAKLFVGIFSCIGVHGLNLCKSKFSFGSKNLLTENQPRELVPTLESDGTGPRLVFGD